MVDDRRFEPVRARPRRLRWVCWISAACVVAVFTAVALALGAHTGGGAAFRTADQVAMVVLGLMIAGAILAFTRPRLEADHEGVRIRNVVGGYRLPWGLVRAVRFDDGSPWASLELVDDDQVAVMAVQAADKEYAVVTVQALRQLLRRHREGPPGDAAGSGTAGQPGPLSPDGPGSSG